MLKPKITIIAFIAVLASSAATAAPAMGAPGWMVNGSNITTAITSEAVGSPMEQTVLSGGGITVTCAGHHHVSTYTPSRIELRLVLLLCSVNSSVCSLSSTTILNNTAIAEATLEGTLAVRVVSHPATGTLFASLELTGSECAEAGTVPLTGHITYSMPTGQDEKVKQEEITDVLASSGELKLGSSGASLRSSLLSETTSHLAWRFL
jgi:hypothetical protein